MSEDRPETVGSLLRAARDRRGIDLARAARETKIPIAHLEALERSDWAALPEAIYARGFLASYARWLGLDPAPLLAQQALEAPAAGRRPPRLTLPAPRLPRAPRLVLTPGLLVAGLLVLLVVVIVGYLAVELATFARTPQLRISDPPGDLAAYAGSTYLVRGVTEPNATLRVDGLRENPSVVADATGSFQVEVGLVPGANVITLVASDPLTGRDSEPVRRTIIVALPPPSDEP